MDPWPQMEADLHRNEMGACTATYIYIYTHTHTRARVHTRMHLHQDIRLHACVFRVYPQGADQGPPSNDIRAASRCRGGSGTSLPGPSSDVQCFSLGSWLRCQGPFLKSRLVFPFALTRDSSFRASLVGDWEPPQPVVLLGKTERKCFARGPEKAGEPCPSPGTSLIHAV